MRWVRRIVAVALFAAALYVCLRFPAMNEAPVRVDYLLGAFEGVPLWLALLGAFGGGVLLTGVLALYPISKARLLARRYRKAARGLEAEVHELRNLPLAAEPPGHGPADEALETDAMPLERGV